VLHDVGRAGYIRSRNIWDQARIFQSLSFAFHGSGRVSTLASFSLRCIITEASAAVSRFGLTRTDIATSQAVIGAIERLEIESLETKIHLLSTPSRGTTRGSDHQLYLVNFREPRVSNEFPLRQKHARHLLADKILITKGHSRSHTRILTFFIANDPRTKLNLSRNPLA
jgi:hypothetical protein